MRKINYDLFRTRKNFKPLTLFNRNPRLTFEEFEDFFDQRMVESPGKDYYLRVKSHYEKINAPTIEIKEEVSLEESVEPEVKEKKVLEEKVEPQIEESNKSFTLTLPSPSENSLSPPKKSRRRRKQSQKNADSESSNED